MYYSILLLFTAVCSVLCSDVLDLSGADFEERVAEHDSLLVEFFAPWCGHCKRLAPEYEKAATTLKKSDPPVPLAKVDCTTDFGKETCSKFGVSGYPTLKIFRNGEFSSEYNGPREADGIVKFMKSQTGPSSKDLTSVDALDAYLKKDDVVIIGFFTDEKSTLKEEFLKTAEKLREFAIFGHISNAEALSKYSYSNEIVLFRPKILSSKFEEQKVKYSGSADKGEIHDFIKSEYPGLVGHRTQDNHDSFKAPLIVAYFEVDYVKNVKGTNYWRNRIMKVAQNYKNKVNFAIADKNKFSAEVEDYGLSVKGDKPVVAARNVKLQKFNMKSEFSVENFEQFVKDFLDEKLEPHFKSEALPDNSNSDVKTAVALNFDDLVTQSTKDVLIEFYAPWCGHCKKLAPIYEELGAKMKGEEVEIVKMDATANDVPPTFEVHGFPTLYWLPKKDKSNPTRYEGGREVDQFVKYIAKHATDELNSYDRSGKPKAGKEEL